MLVFLAYSFWLPQIVYAAQHRCDTGLSSAYIAFISGTLLFFPLYVALRHERFGRRSM